MWWSDDRYITETAEKLMNQAQKTGRGQGDLAIRKHSEGPVSLTARPADTGHRHPHKLSKSLTHPWIPSLLSLSLRFLAQASNPCDRGFNFPAQESRRQGEGIAPLLCLPLSLSMDGPPPARRTTAISYKTFIKFQFCLSTLQTLTYAHHHRM